MKTENLEFSTFPNMTRFPLFMHFAVVLFASLLFSCTSDLQLPPPPPEPSSSSEEASSSSPVVLSSSSSLADTSSSSLVVSSSSSSSYAPSSSSALTYTYCVYTAEGFCAVGPFTTCTGNGILSNTCPFGSSSSAQSPSSSSEVPSSSSSVAPSSSSSAQLPSSSSVAYSSSSVASSSSSVVSSSSTQPPSSSSVVSSSSTQSHSSSSVASSSSSVVSSSSAVSSSSLMSSSSVYSSGSSSEYTGGSCNAADYGSVNINGQIWMKKNWGCYAAGSKCYNNDPANCEKYGRLYDWSTAMGIDSKYNSQLWGGSDVKHKGVCPSGWHIPSNAEWNTLMNSVGGSSIAGRKLKATEGWYNCGSGSSYYQCEDAHGFAALPGGHGGSGGVFNNVGYYGDWWCASEISSSGAYSRRMAANIEYADYNLSNKILLFSVRCVQD